MTINIVKMGTGENCKPQHMTNYAEFFILMRL